MLLGTDFVDIGLLLAVAIIGAPILAKGLRSLFIARPVTIDLLMGVASVGAFAIGETGEAVAVVLLFTLGEALEAYSAERSRDALRSLLSRQPDEATVLEPHDGEHGAQQAAMLLNFHIHCRGMQEHDDERERDAEKKNDGVLLRHASTGLPIFGKEIQRQQGHEADEYCNKNAQDGFARVRIRRPAV